MKKLIVTADIHGNYTGWLTIKSILNKKDALAVAGDLFDTRYGSYSNPDFQPEAIKKDLKTFAHPLHYVYGNCDSPGFSPGYEENKRFSLFNKSIYLHHGHQRINTSSPVDIVIQGHTHLCSLEKKNGVIYMNPGSVTHPRNSVYTYGIIDENSARLIELKTGDSLVQIDF